MRIRKKAYQSYNPRIKQAYTEMAISFEALVEAIVFDKSVESFRFFADMTAHNLVTRCKPHFIRHNALWADSYRGGTVG